MYSPDSLVAMVAVVVATPVVIGGMYVLADRVMRRRR